MKGFKILEHDDIHEDIERVHTKGWDSGLHVGFDNIANHYNILQGSCTDWTGYPQSGKTELALEFLFNMTNFYGHTHMLFVPDIGSSVEVMIKLIHKYTGETFKRQYHNFITIKKVWESLPHLIHHFKIVHKTEIKAKASPVDLWEYAATYAKQSPLHSLLIDSWKDCWHDYKSYGGNYAQYLSNVLPIRNSIAEQSGLHFHTVIHPKLPFMGKDRKIMPPNYYDMEGGAQWNNSGKCIIAVHRENWDTNITDIYFRKIKPESVGRPTHTPVCLNFDVAKSRYYTISGTQTLFATKQNVLKPNYDQPF